MDENCVICMDVLQYENERVNTLICVHQNQFHTQCIDKWLIKNDSCPICRKKTSKESTVSSVIYFFYSFYILIIVFTLVYLQLIVAIIFFILFKKKII